MKLIAPLIVIALGAATAASAHGSGHLHPHETNGWATLFLLLPASLLAGYALGRIHK